MIKNLPACRRCGFIPWVKKTPWRRKWQPTPVFLPENPTDREAWWTIVHGSCKRVEHDLATEQRERDREIIKCDTAILKQVEPSLMTQNALKSHKHSAHTLFILHCLSGCTRSSLQHADSRCSSWGLVPRPGTERGLPVSGGQSLSRWTTREVLHMFFKRTYIIPFGPKRRCTAIHAFP